MGTVWAIDVNGNATSSGKFNSTSTTQGSLVVPRMTTVQINSISSPTKGEMAFDLTTTEPKFYDGSSFVGFAGGSPPLTSTQIGFGSAGNTLTGSSNLTWDDSSKILNILGGTVNSSGITLQNSISGYIPTTLDYNEESVAVTFVLSGPWSSPRNFPVTFSRVANLVTMSWPDFPAVAVSSPSNTMSSGFAAGGVFIPPRFVDASRQITKTIPAYTSTNGTTIAQAFFVTHTNVNGVFFTVGLGLSGMGTGSTGLPGGDISWTV